jgi:HSP20 family protein
VQEQNMDFIRIRFGDDFFTGDPEIHKSIADMFRTAKPAYAPSQHIWRPHLDIYETPSEIVIMAEIAGVKQEDIQLEVSSKSLKIFGKRLQKVLKKGAKYRLAEISYGYFERNLSMSSPIEMDTVIATYTDGVLQIKLSKLPSDRCQKIMIKTT